MADDSVIVKFGGSIEDLSASVGQARETIEGLVAPVTGLQSAFAGVGEAFAAAFAVDRIKGFAETMSDLGSQTSRASEILGVSAEEIGVCGIRRLRSPPGGAGRNYSRLAGG